MNTKQSGVTLGFGETDTYTYTVTSTLSLRSVFGSIKFSSNTINGSVTVTGYPLWYYNGTLTKGTAFGGTTLATVTSASTTAVEFTPYPARTAEHGVPIANNNFCIEVVAAGTSGTGVYDLNLIFDYGFTPR